MPKVVVVGGGYGGITVASGLDDVADVTLIEQKDNFVHHAAALRGAVDSVWGHTIFMPYTRLLENGQVLKGTVMRVDGRIVQVADHDPIEADYLVLATGTTYPFPAKHMVSQAAIAKSRLDLTRENLSQARRVMLVGAGTVGVEFAGELAANFPDLEITMVEKEDTILGTEGYTDELRDSIRHQLEDMGVQIITGAPLAFKPSTDVGALARFRVHTTAGVEIEADMWFLCYGAQPATGYLYDSYSDVLWPNGTVMVDRYMRVKGMSNVYAVGDITDVRESKRADAARAHARVVVSNIRDQIEGREPSTVYEPGKEWVILPLGPDRGASQLVDPDGNVKVVGPEETAAIKGTDLMVTMIRGQLNLP